MKYIKYMIVPLLVLALVLSACGKDEKKEKQNKEDKELKKELVSSLWKEKKDPNAKEYDGDSSDSIKYEFYKNGKYDLTAPVVMDEGKYEVKNSKLILHSDDDDDMNETIKLDKPIKELKTSKRTYVKDK